MESLARQNSRRSFTEKSNNSTVHRKEVQFIFYKTIEIIIRLEIKSTSVVLYYCIHNIDADHVKFKLIKYT